MRSSILGVSVVAMALFSVGSMGCSSAKCTGFSCGDSDGGDTDGADPFADPDAAIGGGDTGKGTGCVPDPGNFDVPGNNCDDDGDGKVDNPPACDTGLALTGDANQFARAIGLCAKSTGSSWGVVSAAYAQGAAEQHGILPKFGNVIKAREGTQLGVLSSGMAREQDNCLLNLGGAFQGGCPMTGPGTAPSGFPKPAQGCPVNNGVNDVSTVKLSIKVPNNAKGLQFDFNFFSGEWPQWVCTDFNDAFIAYLKSGAFNNGVADNISFDAKKNPVSVNNGFFDRCSPKNAQVGCDGNKPSTAPCAGGDAELKGTGFYSPGPHCSGTDSGGGATGWLTTTAPVKQGETISLEFMIWDTGDQAYDSSVLLDNFQWLAGDTVTGTTRPPN